MRASSLRVRGPRLGSGRAPWRAIEYAALDFETTGLDYARDTIISYGLVPVVGGRIPVGRSVHQLIDPAVPPTPRSQTIHGLRPQDLAGSPSLAEARADLAAGLAGRYLLVWFADVELHFLRAIFGTRHRTWRRRTIDVRNLAIAAAGRPRKTRAELGYSLTGSAERWGVPVANPHDALDDALVTAQLFLVLVGSGVFGKEPALRRLLRAGRPDLNAGSNA
jgi:DNA polymerase-3 subunit epsilon